MDTEQIRNEIINDKILKSVASELSIKWDRIICREFSLWITSQGNMKFNSN
jgi:hypothetical protein